jgi:hypothetical protein
VIKSASGNPYWRGSLSTVDLLVITNLDQLLLIMQTFFYFLSKRALIIGRSTVLNLPLLEEFPFRCNRNLHLQFGFSHIYVTFFLQGQRPYIHMTAEKQSFFCLPLKWILRNLCLDFSPLAQWENKTIVIRIVGSNDAS